MYSTFDLTFDLTYYIIINKVYTSQVKGNPCFIHNSFPACESLFYFLLVQTLVIYDLQDKGIYILKIILQYDIKNGLKNSSCMMNIKECDNN